MKASYTEWIDYLFMKANKSGIPLSGNFELTSRCNLNCKMCYIHKKSQDPFAFKQELTADQWITIAHEAKEQGMLLLLLTGGEPLLRRDFCEIYTECRKMGLLVSINTNASLLTEKLIDFLANDPPIRVNATLYGASAETYQALCGDGTAYHRAKHSVLGLQQAGVRVKLNYSVTPQNYQDASEVYEFARQNQLPIQAATYMFPPVRLGQQEAPDSINRLSPQQAADAKWTYECFYKSEKELTEYCKNYVSGKQNDVLQECQELPTERIRCRAGDTTFWITHDGQMRLCGMMQIPSVNVLQNGFTASWREIRKAREDIFLPAKCSSCSKKDVCEFCPATCYAENGAFEAAPEYICQKTDAYLNLCQKWLETERSKIQ